MAAAAWGQQAAGVRYTAAIEGMPTPTMLATAQGLLETVRRAGQPPASEAHLRRRMARDVDALQRLLQSEGHYGARIEALLDTEVVPNQVTFRVKPGPVYPIQAVTFTADGALPYEGPEAPAIGLAPGAPARAQAILDADRRLLASLRRLGHPHPVIQDREVLVDHGAVGVYIRYAIDPGPRAAFGKMTVEGLEGVAESVVRKLCPWTEGDPFRPEPLEIYQARLYRTNLFSLVQIEPADAVDAAGQLPVTIRISERKHRTMRFGLEYLADEGAGAEALWEHRNMQGLGHQLTLRARFNQTLGEFSSQYRIPSFRSIDQSLVLELRAGQDNPDAYESQFIGLNATLERTLTPHLTVGYGMGFRFAQQTLIDADEETFGILSLPAFARWDSTDDALNPTQGYRAQLRIRPFVDVLAPEAPFARIAAEASTYRKMDEAGRWVVAGRLRLGAVAGGSLEGIPPDERFYAGGGGSIRGYDYKTVGPETADGTLLGGRSLFEAALEVRRKITDTLGVVAFLDAGTAYDAPYPDFSEDLRFGAGLGFRYYTPIGPVRLDVATPLNGRDDDSPVSVYLSIGQAF